MSYQAQAQVATNGTTTYHHHLMVRPGTLFIIGTTKCNASVLLALHVSTMYVFYWHYRMHMYYYDYST